MRVLAEKDAGTADCAGKFGDVMQQGTEDVVENVLRAGSGSLRGQLDDRTDITNVRPSPLGGRVDSARINVPVGMVVTAHITPFDDEHNLMATDLRSRDASILEVAGVVSDRDFAFLGVRPGITQVEIRADNKVVLIIDAVVTEQPTQP